MKKRFNEQQIITILKEAQAVIIVLSNYSIKKPWVREELNASIVAKLSKGTRKSFL